MAKVHNFTNDHNIPTKSVMQVHCTLAPPQERIINGEKCWYSDYGKIVAFQEFGEGLYYLKTNTGVAYTNCDQGQQRGEQELALFEQQKRQNPDLAEQWEEWGAGPLHKEQYREERLNQSMLTPNYGQHQQPVQDTPKPNLKDKLQKFPFFMNAEKEAAKVDLNNFTFKQVYVKDNRLVQTGRTLPISDKMLDAIVTLGKWDLPMPDINTPLVNAFGNSDQTIQQFNDWLKHNNKTPLSRDEWDYLLLDCVINGKDISYGPSIAVNDTRGNEISSFGMVKEFSVDRRGNIQLQSTNQEMHSKGKYVSLDPIEQKQQSYIQQR